MAYRALYRIYRPSSFDEVAGQDHITDVLRNQVKLGRLSHAYLFCGPRGTGKTTMAKILSRAANCLSPIEGEPCGCCEMCRISSAVNGDILEIDAASNNGVDNVRDLIDQAQFAPLQLKKRVFIIDEVHMLSQSAFNALLKTLEEPPEHVLFILATTEPEKLLATVISRCQRFDFKRLSMADIVSYMEKVLQKEGVTAEKDALRTIAHAADGGMRDALSLLNQCISVAGKNLSVNNVREVLGSVEEDILFSLSDMIIAGDGNGCMQILETVVRNGKDLGVLTKDLSAHIRALLLTCVCGKCADLLEVTEETAARYEKQAASTSRDRLLYLSEELIRTRTSMRYFPNPRLLLETALLRMACPEEEKSTEAILARLCALEDKSDASLRDTVSKLEKLFDERTVSFPERNIIGEPTAYRTDTDGNGTQEREQVNIKEASLTPANFVSEEMDTAPFIDENAEVLVRSSDNAPDTANRNEPAIEKSEKQADSDTETVFSKFKNALQHINALAAMALDSVTGRQLVEDRLMLYYDPKNIGKAALLAKQPIFTQLQEAAEMVRPDLKVLLQEKKSEPLSTKDKHLQELFGDKLTIE